MIVGNCLLSFQLHGVFSLKDKRQQVKKICEKTRKHFCISIAEVKAQDSLDFAYIGFSFVSNEQKKVESAIQNIVDYIENLSIAPLFDQQMDIVHYNDFHNENRFETIKKSVEWDYLESWKK